MISNRYDAEVRPPLFLVGESGETGYGRVCDTLAAILAESFNLTHIVLNRPAVRRIRPGYKVMHNLNGDLTGSERVRTLFQNGDGADMLIVSDWKVCTALNARLPPHSTKFRRILYSPMNMEWVNVSSLKSLAQVDHIVFYTHSGEQAGRSAFQAVGIRCPPSTVIPHALNGPNSDTLRRPDRSTQRRTARQNLKHILSLTDDAFVILNPNVDSMRKDVDRTLAAFEIISTQHPFAKLIVKRKKSFKMFDALGFSQERARSALGMDTSRSTPVTLGDDEMTLLYEACDVGINTARTEGWGLANFEHGFTGAPQILPHLATLTEIWRDAALYTVSVRDDQYAHGSDAGSAARLLTDMMTNPRHLQVMSDRTWRRTHDSFFSVESFAVKWHLLLDSIFG